MGAKYKGDDASHNFALIFGNIGFFLMHILQELWYSNVGESHDLMVTLAKLAHNQIRVHVL